MDIKKIKLEGDDEANENIVTTRFAKNDDGVDNDQANHQYQWNGDVVEHSLPKISKENVGPDIQIGWGTKSDRLGAHAVSTALKPMCINSKQKLIPPYVSTGDDAVGTTEKETFSKPENLKIPFKCQRMRVQAEEVQIVLEIINDLDDGDVEEVLPENDIHNKDQDADVPLAYRNYLKGGQVLRPMPELIGRKVIVRHMKTSCWIPGDIESKVPQEVENTIPSYHIQFKGSTRPVKELVSLSDMAYDEIWFETLPGELSIRVLAKLQRLRACGCDFQNEPHYYPGIIAKVLLGNKCTWRSKYLVFFDNGQACYVQHRDIRVMCRGGVEEFSKFQLEKKIVPELIYADMFLKSYPWEFRLKKLGVVIIWQAGKWRIAHVVKRDQDIVKVRFEGKDKQESIFAGSTRFLKVFKDYLRKRFGNFLNLSGAHLRMLRGIIRFDGFEGNVEEIAISKGQTPLNYDSSAHPKFISPLAIPFYFGWTSNDGLGSKRTYTSPNGTSYTSYMDITKYLEGTKSNLQVDWFCLKTGISLKNLFQPNEGDSYNFTLEDISNGKEKIPVRCRNTVDNETFPKEPDFQYSPENVVREDVEKPDDKETMTCCNCVDGCMDKERCACWRLTLAGLKGIVTNKMLQDSGYKDRKLLDARFISEIYECNERCKCRKDLCSNRVVQNGLQWPLEVFKTKHKSWAVRTMTDIPKGSFVCQYAGELRSDEEGTKDAEKFGGDCLLDLNFVRNILEGTPNGWSKPINEIPASKPNEEDAPSAGGKRKSRRIAVAQNKKKSSDVSLPEERHLVINPKKVGNVGRFFNHSCYPNMFAQGVFVDTHDIRFPVIAFFTKRDIKAGGELTWHYGYKFGDDSSLFKCQCGADKCEDLGS